MVPRGTVHKATSAQIDWLTCTGATEESRNRLWEIGQRTLHRAEGEGEPSTRWHAHGYSGWSSCHVQYGQRPDGVILRLGGKEAANQWRHALVTAENVSRLDLAVDCKTDHVVPALAAQVYSDADHVPPREGRRVKRTLITGSDGGQTCYIGSRVSERYGRLYDKGVESESAPAGRWWRWEVEYKGDIALGVAKALKARELEGEAIVATVAKFWHERTLHSLESSEPPLSTLQSRPLSSDDRRISWLAKSIKTTVSILVDRLGRERVLCALGLLPQSDLTDLELPHSHEEE